MRRYGRMTLATLTIAFAVMVVPQAAQAWGTWAGTQVDNTALVSWNAGSIDYTTSDTASFLVDELINLQVTNNGATALTVWPAEPNRPLAFIVQNAGNSTVDLRVSAVDDTAIFVGDVELWYDVDGNGALDTTIDANLGASPYDTLSIAVDTEYRYLIVADVPASPTTGNQPDVYDFLATAYRSNSPIAADNGDAAEAMTVQQVMADTGGTATGDADWDGNDSARATYNLVWANLSMTKSFVVIDSDPMNSGQHAIPGATVRYTLHVLNSGTAAATAISIEDITPLGTTFGAVQGGYPTEGTVDSTDPILWSIPSLAGGSSADLVFDVSITTGS